MSPRSKGQRPRVLARFGLKVLVAALLLIPALSIGLANPVADIAVAKKHGGGGDVGVEDFTAPRYNSTIVILDNGQASPYSSTVNVSGLQGKIVDVNLILRNFTHDRPSDVAVMLEHQGRSAVVMREAGGVVALRNANIVLDQDASASLPENTVIVSNNAYKAADYDPADTPFGGSAPDNGDGDNTPREYLDFFDGITANGAWTLWVRDNLAPISGTLGGWQLEIITDNTEPFIDTFSYKTKQRRTLRVSAARGVLREDPEHGSDNLTADLVTGPKKGKLTFHSDGSFEYKPKGNKKGNDFFTYRIVDELGSTIDGHGQVKIKIKKGEHKKHKHKGKHGKKDKHKKKRN